MSKSQSVYKVTALIIEDEESIRRFLRMTLETEDFKVIESASATEALAAANRHHPDLYLLDLGLPDRDGIEVIKELRQFTSKPIIVITARSQENEKVIALDAGADDYLTKPFGVEELKARVRVAVRHLFSSDSPHGQSVINLGHITIDLQSRLIMNEGNQIHLTPTEFKLLAMLAKSPGKVITQQVLLREVWGVAYEKETHYLRIYMKQLREKLEEIPSMPKYLITETGVGYRLIAD